MYANVDGSALAVHHILNPANPHIMNEPFSDVFEVWALESALLEYVPVVGTTAGGDIAIGMTTDVDSRVPKDYDTAVLQQVHARGHITDSMGIVARPAMFNAPIKGKYFYCHDDRDIPDGALKHSRFNSPGRIFAVSERLSTLAGAVPANVERIVVGRLYLTYKIKYRQRKINPVYSPHVLVEHLQAPAAQADVFVEAAQILQAPAQERSELGYPAAAVTEATVLEQQAQPVVRNFFAAIAKKFSEWRDDYGLDLVNGIVPLVIEAGALMAPSLLRRRTFNYFSSGTDENPRGIVSHGSTYIPYATFTAQANLDNGVASPGQPTMALQVWCRGALAPTAVAVYGATSLATAGTEYACQYAWWLGGNTVDQAGAARVAFTRPADAEFGPGSFGLRDGDEIVLLFDFKGAIGAATTISMLNTLLSHSDVRDSTEAGWSLKHR